MIFDKLGGKKHVEICLLAGAKISIFHSCIGQSGWGDKRIEIWGKRWIIANKSLPQCYTDKDDIIKRTASFPWILGDINSLISLNKRGILTPDCYEKLKDTWKQISDIPVEILRKIAYGNYH